MRRFFYYCFFSQTWYFYHKTHIKWDVIISSSLRLLLKVWIWYRCQNRIENYYQHDGEQLGFYKKVHIKRQHRAGCSLYCKKWRIPIYLTKIVLRRTSNAIFNMKKVERVTWTNKLFHRSLKVNCSSILLSHVLTLMLKRLIFCFQSMDNYLCE